MRKNLTERHWSAIEDYCNGIRSRDIADKYKMHDGELPVLAKLIGISPRPTGFASYVIAHKWVTKARLEYEKAKDQKHQRPAPIAQDHQHHP